MSISAFGSYEYRCNRRAKQDSLQYSKVCERGMETGIWRDEEGYDAEGFNKKGYNRFGFDRNNRHKDGTVRTPVNQEQYFVQLQSKRILDECDEIDEWLRSLEK